MHVFLNVKPVRYPLTGVGVYTLQLARGLEAHASVDGLHCFRYGKRVDAASLAEDAGVPAPPSRRGRVSAQVRRILRVLPYVLEAGDLIGARTLSRMRRGIPDAIYHEPNFVPVPSACPQVVTVHDLSHIHYPRFHPPERVRYLERNLVKSMTRAARVITVSDFVREELIRLLGVPAEKVRAIPNGVDARFHPMDAAELSPALGALGLSDTRYLLAVATLEPRKNLQGLLEAYLRLPSALRRAHPLVIAGAKGWRTGSIERALVTPRDEGSVRWLDYVPPGQLPALYAGAFAFAYPSFYEGFGLPPLEAMASGVPVLTSSGTAMVEVCGDAALLADPHDTEALSEGLRRLLEDDALRAAAMEQGPRRAARFTWPRCVNDTVAVYEDALSATA